MRAWIVKQYDNLVISRPLITLILMLIVIGFFSTFVPNFKLDASADSLLLENDQDLKYYRQTSARYASDDFLVITYKSKGDLLSESSLSDLNALQNKLEALDRVSDVITILDVPLINSPQMTMGELTQGIRTLHHPDVSKILAKQEFIESPFYRNLLMSPNGETTVLLVNFNRDQKYYDLLNSRNTLREIKLERSLSDAESIELEKATSAFSEYSALVAQNQKKDISDVRHIMNEHRANANMFLGGIPMITSDMIDYIDSDLKVFGAGVFIFLLLMLITIYRSVRWVALPLLGCSLAVVMMIGMLGFLDWRVTVISSNFVSLLLIITMSMTIHLVVRYREMHSRFPNENKESLVKQVVHFMFIPCVYTSLTTIVAFISLLVSNIRPVIDFGYMMTMGITAAFLITFILFPSVLMILKQGKSQNENDFTKTLTLSFASFTQKNTKKIILIASFIAIFSGFGIAQLQVENRFIDYFHEDTEIHQGMLEIDQQLGGTTPLDIILDADPNFIAQQESNQNLETEEDEFLDDMDELFGDEDDQPPGFWFNKPKLAEIRKVHDYLDSLPEVGKVLSLTTLVRMAEIVNEGESLDDIQVGAMREALPSDVQDVLVRPFLSEDANQTRLTLRVIDSNHSLKRKDLIQKISHFLENEMGYSQDVFHITGMLVLYNNMLQSLYASQIQTIGFVFFSILIMFLVLFRSFSLAIIAILPNMLPAVLVLGFMGWKGIPLDMMTITIAAISVGIAVDNTIHYIVRFRREFPVDRDYLATVRRCHGSIGKAMYYTSITIIVGFSILALSNFIPTIYFGLLTGLAMFTALLSSLTFLPALLIALKPLGRS
ncbi:MAG: MMPL family transporter [Pseudomonadota bacterium]